MRTSQYLTYSGSAPACIRAKSPQFVGHEQGFTFTTHSPLRLDLAGRQHVVKLVQYPGLELELDFARAVQFNHAFDVGLR